MPKISIIVPVYKAEKYIRRCLDSIVAQTFTDWECLLIDDGSPDNSGKICDEYAEMDGRFRVFHKENGGVSSARQLGLDNSIGDYIIHCDPDDWVDANMLEKLSENVIDEGVDMVICDFYKELSNKSEYCSQNLSSTESSEILQLLLSQKLWGATWNKLVRRGCFFENNISFPINLTIWEDLFVICELMRYNIKVTYFPKAFYHYDCFSNNNSLVRFVTLSNINSQIFFCNYFANVLDAVKYSEGLYYSKLAAKQSMYKGFLNNVVDKNFVINNFSEINSIFVKKINNYFNNSILIALYLLIKGYNKKFVNFIYSMHLYLLKCFSFVKNTFN